MNKLQEIREKLLAQERKQQFSGGDNAIYPHWNTPENETSVIRFLPDGDPDNDFFWIERQMINLAFSGVKGQAESKPVTVKVPCIEMWGNQKCPIHEEIRPWFKDPSMEDIARKYWKKRSNLYQGFVVNSAFTEDELPENPIRRFVISNQIHGIIKAALMDPEFGEELPTDYDKGVDFRVSKTKKGQYADYSSSNWSRKERSLNQEERDAIEEHGLFELKNFLPKKPTEEDLNIIFQMFESSLDGELYDPERFAEHYRPWGMDAPNSGDDKADTTKVETKVKTKVEAKDDDVVIEDDVAASDEVSNENVQDILAKIRARKETA